MEYIGYAILILWVLLVIFWLYLLAKYLMGKLFHSKNKKEVKIEKKKDDILERNRKRSVEYFEQCRQKTIDETQSKKEEIQFVNNINNKRDRILQTINNSDKDSRYHNKLATTVKGTMYRSASEIAAARSLNVGDRLILKYESGNTVDTNAVLIYTINGYAIGYVPASESKLVKQNIKHVSGCTVTKISNHDIPFIDIIIEFSESEQEEQEFIPEELQVTPEDRMINLICGEKRDYEYTNILALINGTFELPNDNIDRARKLRQGDKLILKKAEESKLFPYRLDVYTEDYIFIGFLYNNYLPYPARDVYVLFDKIRDIRVRNILDEFPHGQICINIFLPEKQYNQSAASLESISAQINIVHAGPYPQLTEAEKLKRLDTEKALEIALPIAQCEKGIDAKFLCCQCYRIIKDYEKEMEIILKIIDRIETISPEYISRNEYDSMKRRKEEFTKRLATVESRLQSKNRKKK